MITIPKFQDLSGQVFGMWTVIERVDDYVTPGGNRFTRYECVCSCPQQTRKYVLANALKSGKSTSCGCRQRKSAAHTAAINFTTHGESDKRLYKIWLYMHKRCENSSASNYRDYGGRGICVCDSWSNYEPFRAWALRNGYNDSLSIDRIDVNGDYTPENCRWADRATQANNRRNTLRITYNGEEHSLSEWAAILQKPYKSLYKRIHNQKMSAEQAFDL